jgi:hypothetical protein
LSARPPEFYRALIFAAPLALLWAIGVGWLLVRMPPAAAVDGHRPARTAASFGWRLTRGRSGACWCGSGYGLDHSRDLAALGGTVFLIAAIVDRVAAASTALHGDRGNGGRCRDRRRGGRRRRFLASVVVRASVALLRRRGRHAAGAVEPAAIARPIWVTGKRVAVLIGGTLVVNAVATLTTLEGASGSADFLVIAHRAGAHDAPENTLLALERAIAARADLAEIDVQRTKDGVVVVVHDADLMRMARDPRKIAATDYAAFADVRLGLDDESAADERRLARLDEFLDRANGRIRLAIELKYYEWDPLLAPQVLSEIRARAPSSRS